jgi:hypothetical protein
MAAPPPPPPPPPAGLMQSHYILHNDLLNGVKEPRSPILPVIKSPSDHISLFKSVPCRRFDMIKIENILVSGGFTGALKTLQQLQLRVG